MDTAERLLQYVSFSELIKKKKRIKKSVGPFKKGVRLLRKAFGRETLQRVFVCLFNCNTKKLQLNYTSFLGLCCAILKE